jgi:hypothetical protein
MYRLKQALDAGVSVYLPSHVTSTPLFSPLSPLSPFKSVQHRHDVPFCLHHHHVPFSALFLFHMICLLFSLPFLHLLLHLTSSCAHIFHLITFFLSLKGACVLEMPSGTGKTVSLLSLITSYQVSKPNETPKLIYCSRTIQEIEKVLEEAKRVLAYRDQEMGANAPRTLCVGLSSRKNLCIHPDVSEERDGNIVDRYTLSPSSSPFIFSLSNSPSLSLSLSALLTLVLVVVLRVYSSCSRSLVLSFSCYFKPLHSFFYSYQ